MTAWRRWPSRDEYSEAGEGVIMLVDGRVVSFSAVAWTLLSALEAGPLDLRSIAGRLADSHGPAAAEDGTDLTLELTRDLLEELEQSGIVYQSS